MASNPLPIRAVEAWEDSTGTTHPTKEGALTVEVERVLGRIGNGESLTPGLARKIIDQREALIPLLEAFGPVVAPPPVNLHQTDGQGA